MLIIISLILDYKQKGFDPGLLLREKIYWAHDYKKKKKSICTHHLQHSNILAWLFDQRNHFNVHLDSLKNNSCLQKIKKFLFFGD